MRRFQSARAFAEALEATAVEANLIFSHAEVAKRTRALVDAVLERRREIVRERIAELETKADSERAPRFVSPVLPPMPEAVPPLPTEGAQAFLGGRFLWLVSRPRLTLAFALTALVLVALAVGLRPADSAESGAPAVASAVVATPPRPLSPPEPLPVVDATPELAPASSPSAPPKSPEKTPRSPGKPRTPSRPPGHP